MGWLSRTAARLVPAERRDWAEAVWAEAGQVPPGLTRLAWRAGGLRLIAGEALLPRRAGQSLVFAAAAAWVALAVWPGPAGNPATAVARLDVVTVLPLLALLPLLARRLLGSAAGSIARILRACGYSAVLVLVVAKASVEQVADNPAAIPHISQEAWVPALTGMIFTWLVESLFLLVVAVYVAALLGLTARRSRVAPATLAAGTTAGIVIGAVMYAVAPLGLSNNAPSPWLHGPVAVLAWVLLLGAPVAAGIVARWRYRGPGSPEQVARARLRQCGAAGFMAGVLGTLIFTVLGTGTIALMPRADWLQRWLYPGQHLLAVVAYNRELTASVNAAGYFLTLLVFPVFGLVLGLAGGGAADPSGPSADGSSFDRVDQRVIDDVDQQSIRRL